MCKANNDVWMKPNVKPDGTKYWEYVLCYVDDILAVSHEPQKVMDHLSTRYILKKGSVKEPDLYLGANIKKCRIPNSDDPGKVRWGMSSDDYVKRAVADVERALDEEHKYLPKRVVTPMVAGYQPELDVSPELNPKRCSYLQGLIGILRWMCKLGRLDIMVPVSMLS